MKTFIVAIDPNKIYFEVEANTPEEAKNKAVLQIEDYFLDNGSVEQDDLTIDEVKG